MKLLLTAILIPLSLALPAQEEANKAAANCPSVCPLVFDPACGKNAQGELKLFSNSCYLEAANNCYNGGYQQVSSSECRGMSVSFDFQPAGSEAYPNDDDE